MTAEFIPEVWAEETAAMLRFLERLGFPILPHRIRFWWWHRHFCQPCQDYDRKVAERWKQIKRGQTLHIPRFDVLN